MHFLIYLQLLFFTVCANYVMNAPLEIVNWGRNNKNVLFLLFKGERPEDALDDLLLQHDEVNLREKAMIYICNAIQSVITEHPEIIPCDHNPHNDILFSLNVTMLNIAEFNFVRFRSGYTIDFYVNKLCSHLPCSADIKEILYREINLNYLIYSQRLIDRIHQMRYHL